MSTGPALAAVTGPLLGLLVVVIAYCLGIFLSIKCCRPVDGTPDGPTTLPHSEILQQGAASPGVDIFIVSRSEDYLVNIPRPTFISRQFTHNNPETAVVTLAPAYEAPPTYEECVRDGLA